MIRVKPVYSAHRTQALMSSPEVSGQDLNPNPNSPLRHPNGAFNGNIPDDPLLQSGSFIDPTTTSNARSSMEAQKAQTTAAPSNGSASVTPGPENPDSGAGRVKRKGPEPLDWLPRGWLVEDKVRSSGATAGSTDRYYFDPVTGRRFRSKKEVLYFLETGTMIKRKKTTENASADKPSVEGSGSHKQKKSSTKPKSSTLNFDFSNVPEMVSWVLTDSSEGSWIPFIGDKKVPQSTKQEWDAAFTFLTSRTSGHSS